MRVAEHFKEPDTDALRDSLSYAELMRWRAWEELTGPLGNAREDIGIANVTLVLANVYRSRRAPYKLKDVFPFPNPLVKPRGFTDEESILAFFKALSEAQEMKEKREHRDNG